MAFRFSLAPLLRYRQVIEHQRELRLAAANQQVNLLRLQIDNLFRQTAAMADEGLRQIGVGVNAAQLHFDLVRRAALHQHLHRLQSDLAAAVEVRSLAQAEFQRAHSDRESLEAVRRTQLEIYQQQEVRHQQRQADDLFLLRRKSRN